MGDDCVTVVSELIANVVEHGGGGEVGLWLLPARGALLGLLVHDADPVINDAVVARLGARARDLPVRMPNGTAARGRGLAIVDELCVRWQSVPTGPGTSAWCWELREDADEWRDRQLSHLREMNPNLIWYGETTRRWWAMTADGLLETTTPEALSQKLNPHPNSPVQRPPAPPLSAPGGDPLSGLGRDGWPRTVP
ncbi:hypothetical protein [Actinocorallia sp. A-T 12471]|uniref:hypothetical protein n=1 Tax=Actinocorallia sp. A-T 12471 TaxID=3089813 RepID=UPI0029D3D3CA|nr:hypothetical protein [Actinocorallia sp. A-T 12471]MDX6738947.1 hypothetical protein [Actinocorallia sp. A-T 12471]